MIFVIVSVVLPILIFIWIRFMARIPYPIKKSKLNFPDSSPYRENSSPSEIPVKKFHLNDFAQGNYVCQKCGRTVFQSDRMSKLCQGDSKTCPVSREHFHWTCLCGHAWMMATKDNPEGGSV